MASVHYHWVQQNFKVFHHRYSKYIGSFSHCNAYNVLEAAQNQNQALFLSRSLLDSFLHIGNPAAVKSGSISPQIWSYHTTHIKTSVNLWKRNTDFRNLPSRPAGLSVARSSEFGRRSDDINLMCTKICVYIYDWDTNRDCFWAPNWKLGGMGELVEQVHIYDIRAQNS